MGNLVYKKSFIEDDFSIGNAIKTAFKYVLYAIVVAILVAMIFGVRFFFVGGWSMQPTINYMSLIAVNENVDKYNLKEGDIATFKMGELVNTHRIIKVNKDGNGVVVSYETKGDNPNLTLEDPILYPQNVIGVVCEIFEKPVTIPELGNLVFDIKNNIVLIFLFLAGMFVFFALTPKERDYISYDVDAETPQK